MTPPATSTSKKEKPADPYEGKSRSQLIKELDKLKDDASKFDKNAETLNRQLEEARKQTAFKLPDEITNIPENTESSIPEGDMVLKNAKTLFGLNRKVLDFDVPTFEWKHPHPHVPEANPNYIFKEELLMPVLWALATNKKAWLSGHTGTGKSTLIKEVCARLNWPMLRVNFDSEITRMDLIGRDVLEDKDGVTVSRFVDGILPTALSGPYVLLCDEVDFIRPDIAYVFQRALEDEGLLIAEDGGRVIHPHPFSRIVATGNTKGQGDEIGIYQGARSQSVAFLDRFTAWLEVGYLSTEEETELLAASVPTLTQVERDAVIRYVKEHRNAFTGGEIMLPISPRGLIALGQAYSMYLSKLNTGTKETKAKCFKSAMNLVILARANSTDKSILSGIVDRIVA